MAGNFGPSTTGPGHSFQARLPGGVTNLSATGPICCPGSERYLLPPSQHPILIGQHHTQLAPQAQSHVPWPRLNTEPHHDQVDLTGRDDSSPEPENTYKRAATVFLQSSK